MADKQRMTDAMIEELLASEARAMADAGQVPDTAPSPSVGLTTSVRDLYAAAEARLEEVGQQGMLSRDSRKGNTRNLVFYPTRHAQATGRSGLFIENGEGGASHYTTAPDGVLMENVPYLTQLELLLVTTEMRTRLGDAAAEAHLRSRGVL